MTIENRALPYWKDVIVPQIITGKTLLIAGHGNLLRGFIKYLDDISDGKYYRDFVTLLQRLI